MKKIIFIFICVLLFVACEQKTDLVIHNHTDFYLDYTLDGVLQPRIEPNDPPARHSFSLGRKYTFYNPTKKVMVKIWGPVYRRGFIDNSNQFRPGIPEERSITLRHDENYRIRIRPNRVSLIINNSKDHNFTINSIRLAQGGHDYGANLILNNVIRPGDPPYHIQVDRNVNDFGNILFAYNFEFRTVCGLVILASLPDVKNVGEYIKIDFPIPPVEE